MEGAQNPGLRFVDSHSIVVPMKSESATASKCAGSTDSDAPLWDFVTLKEYQLPPAVLDASAVRRGVRGFVRNLLGRKREAQSPFSTEQNLQTLGEAQLSRLVPQPQWAPVAQALQQQLNNWMSQESPTKSVLFLVGPPYSGRRETLEALAERDAFVQVTAPGSRAIVDCDNRWFKSWPRKRVWILPQLEKVYLRQADGLDLVREFLARALLGELGQGIVGCDSWAWAFLRYVWAGRPSFCQTIQAFDHQRLMRLFTPAEQSNVKHRFRHSDNGAYVLPPSDEVCHDSAKVSTGFLEKLAAYSRGNPGVAGAIWRRSLQCLPEGAAGSEVSEVDPHHRDTVWVKSWERVQHPEVPADAGMVEATVLHGLLLHDGLSVAQLAAMLPDSRAQISETILYLVEAGLVQPDEANCWRVAPAGYPAVRAFLQINDYLVDQF